MIFVFEKEIAIYYYGTWEKNFSGIGRYLSAGWAISLPTSPAKHVEVNTQKKNCNSINFYPIRSKKFHRLLANNFPLGCQDCTSFCVSLGSLLKKKVFKMNLSLRAEKLNFWQTFFVGLVIAEFYVSRGFLKNKKSEKTLIFSQLVEQSFFGIQHMFSVGYSKLKSSCPEDISKKCRPNFEKFCWTSSEFEGQNF